MSERCEHTQCAKWFRFVIPICNSDNIISDASFSFHSDLMSVRRNASAFEFVRKWKTTNKKTPNSGAPGGGAGLTPCRHAPPASPCGHPNLAFFLVPPQINAFIMEAFLRKINKFSEFSKGLARFSKVLRWFFTPLYDFGDFEQVQISFLKHGSDRLPRNK